MTIQLAWSRPSVAAGCAALVLAAVGCESDKLKTYPVTGRVVYKGSGEAAVKLAGGSVYLESVADPKNVQATGQIEEGGVFALGSVVHGKSVEDVLPGEYRVRVRPPTNDNTKRPARGLIDPRYQTFDKSGIRLTIAAGANPEVVIEVEKPAAR